MKKQISKETTKRMRNVDHWIYKNTAFTNMLALYLYTRPVELLSYKAYKTREKAVEQAELEANFIYDLLYVMQGE